MLVTSVESADDVARVSDLAAESDAVLAILPTRPDAPEVARAAQACGFDETARYYVGQPVGGTADP